MVAVGRGRRVSWKGITVLKSVDHRASEQIVEGCSVAQDGCAELLDSGIAEYRYHCSQFLVTCLRINL
jgi:hypothetical protein